MQGQDLDAVEMRGPDTRYLCCSASGRTQVLLSAAHWAMQCYSLYLIRMCKEASISQDVAGGVGGPQQGCPLPGSVSEVGNVTVSLHPPSPDHGHMFLHSRDTSLVIARGATQATSSYRGQAVKYPSNMLNISSEQCNSRGLVR